MQISADPTASVAHLRPRERFWNAPNAVTLARIAASPLLLLLLLTEGRVASLGFGLGFLAVALTDLLDGYLARRFGCVTRLGKLLDPLADKLLAMTALVLLVALDGRLPVWALPLVVVILAREMAVTALRAMASAEGVVIPASQLGKWKTGFQAAAITGLLIHYPWLDLPVHEISLGLLLAATALTVWSGYDYFAGYLGAREQPPT